MFLRRDNGDHDKAIADQSEAIRQTPKFSTAYVGRGVAFRLAFARKGDYDKAIADYNEAIRLNPKDAAAYFNRGVIFRKRAKGQKENAEADLAEAEKLGIPSK